LCLNLARSSDPLALIDFINTKSDWEAQYYPRFSTITRETASTLLGYIPSSNQPPVEAYKTRGGLALPKAFDSRKQWSNCTAMFNPLDQGQCGSCWAFGCVKSLSQRFCVATNSSFNLELSEQQMVSCNLEGLEACGGGDPVTAFRYAAMYGLPLNTCVPYVSGDGNVPSCTSQCTDSEKWNVYYASALSLRWHLTLDGIMESLYNEGPVEACFHVYEDFMNYKSGVYKHVTGDWVGGHCVVIVGWGTTDKGVDYWIVQNSWGKNWGLDGFFWIARGVDECGIEWQVFSALPSL